MFSHHRVDTGTELLLRYAPPPPPEGNLLDLGAGYGPIAVALALRAPLATVWAVDVNRRALDLVRANAAAIGLENIRSVEPDEVPGGTGFSAIYCNPPIKVGKETMHGLLARWLPQLTSGASAYLVVKRSLGSDSLVRWLEGAGYVIDRLRSKQGYRVLEVTRP